MSNESIFLIAMIIWGIYVFAPIIYVAIKITPEDFYDDNDPKNWDLVARESKR